MDAEVGHGTTALRRVEDQSAQAGICDGRIAIAEIGLPSQPLCTNSISDAPNSVYRRGKEFRPSLWNDIHASIDYGGANNGFVEGSEFMPQGYPFTCGLKLLCEGGVAEFMFRAGGVSVEMGGGSTLLVHAAGKAFPLVAKPDDGYRNQADYFVACVCDSRMPAQGTPEQARLAVRTANAARQSFETGAVVPI